MKRDLKLNMSHLDAISRKVQSYIAVRDFLNNSELQGQAFDNLRMQMEDYLMILRTMRAANCSNISDFNTLSGSVGDEELDGAKILEQQREALRQKENYENAAEEYRQLARNEDTLYLKYHYSQCEQQNLDLALVQGLLYEAWKKKEEKYDAIDNATAKLFTTVGSMRSIAREGLEYMKYLKKSVYIVILVGFVIGAIWGWKYYENEQIKKQNAYFTKNKLSASEMNVMVFFYHVKSNPEWMWDDPDKDKWPDYSNYTIEPTEDKSESTEDTVSNEDESEK